MQTLDNASAYRDVFELKGVPKLRRFYDQGVFVWKRLYEGYYEPWHSVPCPTVADAHAHRRLMGLNMARAVCGEMASLVWGEQCAVTVSRDGQVGDGDPLNDFVQDALLRSGFWGGMRRGVERCLALGTGVIRVWPQGGTVRLGFSGADQFVPLSWDGGEITGGLFVDRFTRSGKCYTRLEWHQNGPDGVTVRNELYLNGDGDTLGQRTPLKSACPQLNEVTKLPLTEGLFHCFKSPLANPADGDCPMGVSLFAGALDTLHGLDVCYDSLVREFRLGKKRLVVPARAVRAVPDPVTGELRRYFDANDEAFEALAWDDGAQNTILDCSPPLRVDEHVAALNAMLRALCLQTGFSAGSFSFDGGTGIKTATEVVSENSKTYKTVRDVQNQLTPALKGVVKSIIDLASLCGLTWQGVPVKELAQGGYHVAVVFDDGITQDRQTNVNEGMRLVQAGLLSKYTFLTEPKYGMGMTPEAALAEMGRIDAGQRGSQAFPRGEGFWQ